ncbi:hypothetical protein TNCV_1872631 [Trichonephila clavipes]|nr:hypothetical protein TNCV_1872631 [Trichonephila clavipes]
MTFHNRLDDSLRWIAGERLEAGTSQAEETRWLQMGQNWSPGYGINSKQVVLSPERSSKVTTEHRQRHSIATWHQVRNDIGG